MVLQDLMLSLPSSSTLLEPSPIDPRDGEHGQGQTLGALAPVFLLDAGGRVAGHNAAAAALLGEVRLGRPFAELLGPDDAERITEALVGAVQGQPSAALTLAYLAQGLVLALPTNVSPFALGDGSAACLVTLELPDAAPLQPPTASSSPAEQGFFARVLEQLPVEVAVLGPDYRYRYLNPEAVKNADIRRWLIGKTDFEYCAYRLLEGDLARRRREHLDHARSSGETVSLEETFATPNGTRIHQRHYKPVFGETGELEFFLGFGRDVTEARTLQAEVELVQKRLHSTLANLTDAFVALDSEGRFRYLNAKAEELIGQPRELLLGRYLRDTFPHAPGRRPNRHWLRALASRKPYVFEQYHELQGGWFEVYTYPTDEGLAVYVHNVTQRHAMQEALQRAKDELEARVRSRTAELEEAKGRLEVLNRQLQHDALHDILTGLPNRALFYDRLGQAIERFRRSPGQGFAVLFLDFDRFKVINDSLGHAVGDALLVALGERLQGCVRPQDTVARLGGDEFAILLSEVAHTPEAQGLAERLCLALETPFRLGVHELKMSASIGIVPAEPGYTCPEDVLRDADIAMYRAKLSGKAQYRLFGPDMRDEAMRRLQLENDLRSAVAEETLEVAYQPILRIDNGAVIGFEALVRWRHPLFGPLSPEAFIPLAEETGLIIALDRLVLRQACKQLKVWQAQFGELQASPLTLNVNLSSRQFSRPELACWLRDTLQALEFDPHELRLELTESIFMSTSEQVLRSLAQLRALGAELHIDDFGTGYSSLAYLQNLPVSTLKIDRSFIARMDAPEGTKLVQSIIAMARALGLSVTAEGVETREQLAGLRSLGCEHAQGYLFAKPLTPEGAEALLRERLALENA